MFDLESELRKWRQQMLASGLASVEVIRELEDHLREDIERHVRKGETMTAAFYGACARLGKPIDLTREFEIANPAGIAGLWRRHRKIVGVCIALGLAIAAITQVLRPRPYVSEAKLFVRSALERDRKNAESPVFPRLGSGREFMAASGSDLMASLVSETLFEDVARAVGPGTVLKKMGGGSDLTQAAAVIRHGFFWTKGNSGTSDLHLSFRHPDADVVEQVLSEFIARLQPGDAKSTRGSSVNAPDGGRITARVFDAMTPLNSESLFEDVARKVGPSIVLKKVGGGENLVQAASVIRNGLRATASPGSSVIHLGFRHPDASVVQPVLGKVIARVRALSPELTVESLRVGPDGVSLSTESISSIAPILAPSVPRFDSQLVYRQTVTALSVGIALGLLTALILVLRAHRLEKQIRLV